MATIKSFTDLEQSKKLAEILPLESADMVHFGIHLGMDGKYYLSGTNAEDDVVPIYKNLCTKVFVKVTAIDVTCQLPCWSLAALLGVLPEKYIKLLIKEEGMYRILIKDLCMTSLFDNPVDACVAMIEELHKLKML